MLAIVVVLLAATPAEGASTDPTVSSGDAAVSIGADPWTLTATQKDGAALRELRGAAAGGLGVRDAAGWHRVLRAASVRREGDALTADLVLAGGRTLALRIAPAR